MVAIVDSCVLYNWNLLKVSTLNIFTKKKGKMNMIVYNFSVNPN